MIFKFSEFSQFAFVSFLYNREEVIYDNGDKGQPRRTQLSAPQAHCGREQSGQRGAQASPDIRHSPWGRAPARCPDGCGRGLHSALVSGTCVSQEAEPAALASARWERRPKEQRVQASGAWPPTPRGTAWAAPRNRGSECTGSPHLPLWHVEESSANATY